MTTSTNVKVCPKCDKKKPQSEFYKYTQTKSGFSCYCKTCLKKKSSDYLKTRKGLSIKIYNGQKTSSKRRNHPMPNYTLSQFQDWFFSQPNFESLYIKWVGSDYKKELIPSVDRLKDELPYTLNNIRLVSFLENHKKQFNKIAELRAKEVFKFSLDGVLLESYPTLKKAAQENNMLKSSISMCCNGTRNTSGGYRWSFNCSRVRNRKQIKLKLNIELWIT